MSSLYKPKITTYALPDGRHRNDEGKRVTKATPGAVKKSHLSAIWYGAFKDSEGVRHCVPLCVNKEAAKQMLAKMVTDAALGRVGALDPFEASNQLSVAKHLDDFEIYLRSTTNKRGRKNTEMHVRTTMQRARAIVDGCRFKRLRDIAKLPVEKFLNELKTSRKSKAKISAQSRNFYLQCIGQFCRWLVEEERLPRNPLAKLKKENVELDQRHKRRAFTMEELPWIFATTKCSKFRFRGLTGADRIALYATAMGTGFRVSELGSLTPGSFDLDRAYVNVKAEFTKDRKAVRNRPIPQELADHLRTFLADKAVDAPIWPGTWTEKAAKMVKADLAAARKAWINDAKDGQEKATRTSSSGFLVYRNAEGEFADAHSWRHTFVSLIVASGVNSKMAMELARHSSLELTLGRYAHVEQAAVVEAVNRMPQFLAATGTDGPRLERASDELCGIGEDG